LKLKKIVLAGALALSLVTLTACSPSASSKGGTNVVTMKGDTIEEVDVYDQAAMYPQQGANKLIQDLTFSKIFEKEFASKVTTSDVQKKYDTQKTQYGSSWSSYLSQSGFTETSYKASLRLQLLEQYAIDKEIAATEYTTAKLKTAWTTYYPTVDAYVVSSSTKTDVQTVHDQATSDFSTFKSTQDSNGTEVKFDSSNTTIPATVQEAASKLQNGQSSEVIAYTDSNSSSSTYGQTTYYFVYMISNPGKGSDYTKYKTQLQNYIKSQKESDQTFVASVFKKYLTKYNVIVKDKNFSSIFSNYIGTSN
jgi:foldase protein PrsA